MFNILAETLLSTIDREHRAPRRTRAAIAERAREARRREDTEFLRRYGDRHF